MEPSPTSDIVPLIRKARPSDADPICKLWIRSIREICGPLYGNDEGILSFWCAHKSTERVEKMIQDTLNIFLVATNQANEIYAIGILCGSEIRACYVSPDFIARGIGQAILAALEAEARLAGVTKLELGSTRNALLFYKRQGYQQLSPSELLFQGVIPYFPMEKILA